MVQTSGGNKVVVIPHSMGSLYFLHFLKWVEAPAPMGGGGGPDWCARHIKATMNIAGPLLGVPKAFAGLFSAEAKDIAVARWEWGLWLPMLIIILRFSWWDVAQKTIIKIWTQITVHVVNHMGAIMVHTVAGQLHQGCLIMTFLGSRHYSTWCGWHGPGMHACQWYPKVATQSGEMLTGLQKRVMLAQRASLHLMIARCLQRSNKNHL